ncbi:MAG: CBS domain-containing protein [Acidobacteriota bacterium]|nr:CBS domain-containing protein [Acidobacteriota bacterium]MDH3524153.1 CBS domain-containing protein [Acidobacteriota bacterium]
MGRLDVGDGFRPEQMRAFSRHLLNDLRALRRMVAEDCFETGVRRIGAEQEMFLVDAHWRPATVALEVIESACEPHLTTELGKFNLELNLDPLVFTGSCLSRLEAELKDLLTKVQRSALEHRAQIVLTGILPTLEKSHLAMEYMAPVPRYYALNQAMDRLRDGRPYSLRIQGRDELLLTHDNVMLESCNTSFQVHYQVSAEEFARLYNIAQAIAAPVIASGTNSPLLFGRQLWRETRIALFEQSVDTRTPTAHMRRQSRRVSFGRDWLRESVVEIFEENISRFSTLLAIDVEEDSLALLRQGKMPKLEALQLHNGTIYRWNRPCYGFSGGRPHLRIENRILPAGPTVLDEVANAALWVGLMSGLPEHLEDVSRVMHFTDARENLVSAARLGLGANLVWPGLGRIPAAQLILEHLLPIARCGLESAGIEAADVDRYLGVITERVRTQKTGSQWLIDSLDGMKPHPKRSQSFAALVAATIRRQQEGSPVHTWEPAAIEEAGESSRHYNRVEQLMTTDLFTVNEEEVVDVVAAVMKWRHVRRIPVEDSGGHLVGLVSYRSLLRVLSRSVESADGSFIAVRDIMKTDLVTCTPELSTLEAARLMREHHIGSLPVVDRDRRLVGILTEHDLIELAWPLLEAHLASF